jgi:hypothetical protein
MVIPISTSAGGSVTVAMAAGGWSVVGAVRWRGAIAIARALVTMVAGAAGVRAIVTIVVGVIVLTAGERRLTGIHRVQAAGTLEAGERKRRRGERRSQSDGQVGVASLHPRRFEAQT